MSKDLWFARMERLLNEYEDAGMPAEEAYEKASKDAYTQMREELADMADNLRKKEKGE